MRRHNPSYPICVRACTHIIFFWRKVCANPFFDTNNCDFSVCWGRTNDALLREEKNDEKRIS